MTMNSRVLGGYAWLDPSAPNYAAKAQQQQDLINTDVAVHGIDSGAYRLNHYDQQYAQAQQMGTIDANRPGQQINTRPQNQFRDQQLGLAGTLQRQANGTGAPSAADLQMQRGQEANMAQAMSMAASQRGQNAGAGLRLAQQQRAMMGQQNVNDTSLLRAQESAQAQNSLGQLLTGARGQDVGLATGQAQLNQQQGVQNDAMTQYYMNMGFNLDQAQMAAKQAQEAAYAQRYGLNRGIAIQSQAQNMQLVGAALNAGAAMGAGITNAVSDERLKKDIRSAEKDTYSFLDALNASKYRYKDKDIDGDKERVSVMAQELEKSKLGKDFVFETPRGKMVDYGKGLGTLLAAQSSLHKRLKQLEGA